MQTIPRLLTQRTILAIPLFALIALSVLLGTRPSSAQSGTWESKAPMPQPVAVAAGADSGGQFYVFGSPGNSGVSVSQVYDPIVDSWSLRAADPIVRCAATAARINNKIYVAEGWRSAGLGFGCDSSLATTALEIYDPTIDSLTAGAPSLVARGEAVSTVIDGKLYVTGGIANGGFTQFNALEIYDPGTNSWSTGAPIPIGCEGQAGEAIEGKFYVVGGFVRPANTQISTLQIYDPATNTWTSGAPMPTPRSGLYAGVIDGKLYTVAGNNSSGVSGILEIYDPVSNSWTTDPSEPTARYGVTGGVINSKLYVTGGFAAAGSTSSGCFPQGGAGETGPSRFRKITSSTSRELKLRGPGDDQAQARMASAAVLPRQYRILQYK